MGTIDLHTHSAFSDGFVSPTNLLRQAKEIGLVALALTDHETVAGLPEARRAAAEYGVELVPGIELNTDIGRHEVHILGYFIDDTDPVLLSALNLLERQRAERIERMVHQLQGIGIPLVGERVTELAGAGTIGRPHLARAMMELGHATSINDAFDRFLSSGRPGFVPRQKNDPEGAVRLIRHNGGVPVLAHPRTTGDIDGVLERLVPAGLLGMEVYYGEYDAEIHRQLRAIADRWNLLPTGGSDYHGEGFKPGRSLGGPPVPDDTVERLRVAAEFSRTTRPANQQLDGAA